MWKRCAFRIQELAYGGLPQDAQARLDQLMTEVVVPTAKAATPAPAAKPKRAKGDLPAGMTLTRDWHGQQVTVRVTTTGFEWDGRPYRMETLPTMLCAPWAFWAVERILQRRTIGSAITLGAVWAVTASIGHMPSLYWNALVVGLYAALPVASSTKRPGELRLNFQTEAPGVLVVSESWHPDWVATDKGEPVAVRRANGGFLGIPIGPGTHDVHVWYRPWDFVLGCWVSGVFWVGLGAAWLWVRRKAWRGARLGGE